MTHLYVPENFDPEAVLPEDLRRYADCANYFLHRIIWGQMQKKTTLDGFVCLKFDYLRTVIPERVLRRLKNALIEAKVIESDRHYIEGRKSFGYKLLPSYSKAQIVWRTVKDKVTAERVRSNRRAEYKKIRLDVHKYLRKQLKRLEIDRDRALALLEGHHTFELVKIPVEQIALRDFSFSVCRFGRVHTDLTNLSSRVRPALHVGGESLVGIDIANSQPLFLALVVINYRKRGNRLHSYLTFVEERTDPYSNIDEIIQRTITRFNPKDTSFNTPSLPASITTRITSGEEVEGQDRTPLTGKTICPQDLLVNKPFLSQDELSFVELCETGQLYDCFMDRMNFPIRKWAKKDVFAVIYGTNSFTSPLKEDFNEFFPGVAEVVRVHKRKDYRYLPHLMQNIESNFVINTVCRRLMNEIPDAPVFTIHDSILTTRPWVEQIQKIMQDEFGKLGLSPTLHEDDYGDG